MDDFETRLHQSAVMRRAGEFDAASALLHKMLSDTTQPVAWHQRARVIAEICNLGRYVPEERRTCLGLGWDYLFALAYELEEHESTEESLGTLMALHKAVGNEKEFEFYRDRFLAVAKPLPSKWQLLIDREREK